MADGELTELYRLQISTCTVKGWLVSLLISADAGAGFCSGTLLRSLFNFFCFSENVRVMKARRRARPVKKCRLQSINKNALASLSLWVVVSLLNKGACWQLCKGSGRV